MIGEGRVLARAGKGLPALLLAGFLLIQCRLDQPTAREEQYVTVRLNDSLSRYDSVEVLILAAGDTGQVVGKIWTGRLDAPDSLPSYRLGDDESRALSIRVKGYDGTGRLLLDMRIAMENGRQIVTDMPVPKPSPALASLGVSPGALSPPFDPSVREYAVSLAYGQASLEVTAKPVYAHAALRIGILAATPGEPFGPIAMRTGENRIVLNVTAEDTSAQYLITAMRAGPVDTSSNPDTLIDTSGIYRAWKHAALVQVNLKQPGFTTGGLAGARIADFPLLVRLTKTDFEFSQAADSGRDIRFATAGDRALPFEISRWDPVLGEADIFVKMDSLRFGADNEPILMHWGNPGAAPASDPARVFPTALGWSGVWHLEESGKGVPGEYLDATGQNPGQGVQPSLTPDRSVGVLGYGQAFKSPGVNGQVIRFPREFSPGIGTWTLQVWVKPAKFGTGILFAKGEKAAEKEQGLRIGLEAGLGVRTSVVLNGGTHLTQAYLAPEGFVLLGLVCDGKTVSVYQNGYLRESASWTQVQASQAEAFLGAGDGEGSSAFEGTLDEFWAFSSAVPAAYMRLVYENQKPLSTLVTILPL